MAPAKKATATASSAASASSKKKASSSTPAAASAKTSSKKAASSTTATTTTAAAAAAPAAAATATPAAATAAAVTATSPTAAAPAAATPAAPRTTTATKKNKNKIPRLKKKDVLRFTIDCTQPVNDKLIDVSAFEKYLQDRVKVQDKTNNLGNMVVIGRDAHAIHVTCNIAFSKRYLKYLTKKFLKKQQLKDWMHVVSVDKKTYVIKYYNIEGEEEAADEE